MDYEQECKLNMLGRQFQKKYRDVIVDFTFFDESKNAIYLQKRSKNRVVFPNEWEFPGVHMNADENLVNCLKRAVFEEVGVQLLKVVSLVHIFHWESDEDVVNLQFLVRISGNIRPNNSSISEHLFISEKEVNNMFKDNRKSPIKKGALYAFDFAKAHNRGCDLLFEHVLFFDHICNLFSTEVLKSSDSIYVEIGSENEKKFQFNKDSSKLVISPSFLRHYDQFANAWIVLHLLFHNYSQNILCFDNVKSIRTFLGKNLMFLVDIAADIHVYKFLCKSYDFNQKKLRDLVYKTLMEYQADDINHTKFPRLFGTFLTIIKNRSFISLPVINENGTLFLMEFNESLYFSEIKLPEKVLKDIQKVMTSREVSLGDFNKVLDTVTSLANSKGV